MCNLQAPILSSVYSIIRHPFVPDSWRLNAVSNPDEYQTCHSRINLWQSYVTFLLVTNMRAMKWHFLTHTWLYVYFSTALHYVLRYVPTQ